MCKRDKHLTMPVNILHPRQGFFFRERSPMEKYIIGTAALLISLAAGKIDLLLGESRVATTLVLVSVFAIYTITFS